jgi:ribosomal protein S18 acetylase RimI-like enzyme
MIERVLEADWEAWRDVRLEAVQLHPEAFGGSFEEEKERSEEDWRRGLRQVTALAYRETGTILGIAVYAQSSAIKMRHRANLFSMYVRPHARGRGAGGALVKAVLNVAKGKALQVHCNVVTSNDRARRLYERHGFSVYGTEPRALKVGDRFYDEHLMICRLD